LYDISVELFSYFSGIIKMKYIQNCSKDNSMLMNIKKLFLKLNRDE
jgi:hypothetical protein